MLTRLRRIAVLLALAGFAQSAIAKDEPVCSWAGNYFQIRPSLEVTWELDPKSRSATKVSATSALTGRVRYNFTLDDFCECLYGGLTSGVYYSTGAVFSSADSGSGFNIEPHTIGSPTETCTLTPFDCPAWDTGELVPDFIHTGLFRASTNVIDLSACSLILAHRGRVEADVGQIDEFDECVECGSGDVVPDLIESSRGWGTSRTQRVYSLGAQPNNTPPATIDVKACWDVSLEDDEGGIGTCASYPDDFDSSGLQHRLFFTVRAEFFDGSATTLVTRAGILLVYGDGEVAFLGVLDDAFTEPDDFSCYLSYVGECVLATPPGAECATAIAPIEVPSNATTVTITTVVSTDAPFLGDINRTDLLPNEASTHPDLTKRPDDDLNTCDQVVDWSDREAFVVAFGSMIGDDTYEFRADLDFDGDVDAADYAIFNTVPCTLDFNGDATYDILDYLDFLDAMGNSEPAADLNMDTYFDVLDTLDYTDYTGTYGCDCNPDV